jgi:hypothetical protein
VQAGEAWRQFAPAAIRVKTDHVWSGVFQLSENSSVMLRFGDITGSGDTQLLGDAYEIGVLEAARDDILLAIGCFGPSST